MADENPEVSGQTGEAELPTPQFSGSDGSPTSTDADALVSRLAEKLMPQLEETIERKAKSLQDKRFSKIERALGVRSGVLAELEELGTTVPKDVQSELRLRELEERITQQSNQPAPVSDNGLSRQKAAVAEAIAELKKYELDPNDAGFIELLRGQYANRGEFDLKVSRYVVGKLAPQKPANPADVVQPPVRSGATEKGPAQLEADYQKEMAAIVQNTRGEHKLRAITDLKDKYRKAGLQKL
jgi:hypothetical protein